MRFRSDLKFCDVVLYDKLIPIFILQQIYHFTLHFEKFSIIIDYFHQKFPNKENFVIFNSKRFPQKIRTSINLRNTLLCGKSTSFPVNCKFWEHLKSESWVLITSKIHRWILDYNNDCNLDKNVLENPEYPLWKRSNFAIVDSCINKSNHVFSYVLEKATHHTYSSLWHCK